MCVCVCVCGFVHVCVRVWGGGGARWGNGMESEPLSLKVFVKKTVLRPLLIIKGENLHTWSDIVGPCSDIHSSFKH